LLPKIQSPTDDKKIEDRVIGIKDGDAVGFILGRVKTIIIILPKHILQI